jgi:hypothetical protein
MLSAPATIPATSAATLIAGFDPGEPGTRTWLAARSCRPARAAKAMTGISPAHDTRLGSSKTAEMLWQTRIYRMSFFLEGWNSREVPVQKDIGTPRPAQNITLTAGSRVSWPRSRRAASLMLQVDDGC